MVFNYIKNLENLLKVKFFELKGRNIILIDDGKLFYLIVVEIISIYEKGIYEMRNFKKKYFFRFNVVVIFYIVLYLMVKFLLIFFEVVFNIDILILVMNEYIF